MKLINKTAYGFFVKNNFIFFTAGEQFFIFLKDKGTEISKEEFLLHKYGEQNKYWKRPFDECVHLKNGNFITTYYQEQEVRLHNPSGKVINHLEKVNSPYKMGIYGMSIDKNENLWIAAPVEHYIGKFNIEKQEEIFSICGKELEPTIFNYPEYVTIIDNFAYVSDMGNKRIVKIHIENHTLETFKKMDDPIYYFNQINGKNFYLLESGFYVD